MRGGGSAPSQFLDKFSIDQGHFVLHLGIGRHSDRVFEHDERQLRVVQGLLLRPGHSQKGLGNDAHGRDAGLFEVDRILETPGGAAASLADPGDHCVGTCHKWFQHVLPGGAGEERLLGIDDVFDAFALLQ